MASPILRHAVGVAPAVLSTHQRAVNALLELAVFTPELCAKIGNPEMSVPRSEVPALFRAAIEEASPYAEETAILKHALMLLEAVDGGERTPEQGDFFAALAFELDGPDAFRVSYEPLNVTVN